MRRGGHAFQSETPKFGRNWVFRSKFSLAACGGVQQKYKMPFCENVTPMEMMVVVHGSRFCRSLLLNLVEILPKCQIHGQIRVIFALKAPLDCYCSGKSPNVKLLLFSDPIVVLLLLFNSNNRKFP